MKQKTEREKGIIAVVMLSFTYALMPLLPRYLSTSFEIFQQMYLRMFVGFLLLFVIFQKRINVTKFFTLPIKESGWIFFRATLYYFVGVGLYTYAVLTTKISNVAFIGAIPTTAILGFLLLGERITAQKILLVMLSAIGVFVISVKQVSGAFSVGTGEIATLFSAVFVSLGLITRRKRNFKFLNDQETAALMLFFAFVLFFIASLVRGEGLPLAGWSLGIAAAVFAAGLLNACLSFLTNYGLARVEAVLASNIIATDVVFATLFAFLVFQELPTMKEFFGGIIIVFSAVLLHTIEGRKQKAATETLV